MGTFGLTPGTRMAPSFSAGTSLNTALDVLMKHLPVMIGISALACLPYLCYTLWVKPAAVLDYGVSALVMIGQNTITAFCQAILAYATFQALRHQPVSMAVSVSRGLQRLVPVLITALIMSVATTVGMLLLVIPGVIAALMFFVAIPVCVVERLGPLKSLSRSMDLTKGHRGTLFLVSLALGLSGIIFSFLIVSVSSQPGMATIGALLQYVWMVAYLAYSCVLAAIVYHDLRVDREGIDVEQIVSVFD